MSSFLRNRLFALTAALVAVLGFAGVAEADWLTIRNDTGNAIVVRETIVVNGQAKPGKPTNLLPGETIREFIPGPTVKKIEVLDVQNQSLWSGSLNCKEESQTFSVSATGGKVSVGPASNPHPKKK